MNLPELGFFSIIIPVCWQVFFPGIKLGMKHMKGYLRKAKRRRLSG
jgi:hypothetical protein